MIQRRSLSYLISIGLVMLMFHSTSAQADSLSFILGNKYEQFDLPGFGVSMLNKDAVFYQQGFGYADKKKKRPFDEHTLISICSVSKTLLALAVMKAIEEEKLSLDSEINAFLPFKVIHPGFPEKPITVRHLVTHTSGIQDSYWDFARFVQPMV